MNPHWTVSRDSFEIKEMPFYWRLSESTAPFEKIASRMPIRLVIDEENDYLKFLPTHSEWDNLSKAYLQNANIGFVNPDSGQLNTYGWSVHRFFLDSIEKYQPKTIFEIGCGAGYTIRFLKENGWQAVGIDPSEYSKKWSEKLHFPLINTFFSPELFKTPADFIYCNDVFEHIPQVDQFSKSVFSCLVDGGVFCFATTNSTECVALGDISMLEHQHVNMFTRGSIHRILLKAGFEEIIINGGSYGNTFHVVARKIKSSQPDLKSTQPDSVCPGFFDRLKNKLDAFSELHQECKCLHCYVPLRSIPYLAAVGDFGETRIYDSNPQWRDRYIDGYSQPIRGLEDIKYRKGDVFFIGSLTFYNEIKKNLMQKGFPQESIVSFRQTQ
jgi:SAM-dependent methyltransferase